MLDRRHEGDRDRRRIRLLVSVRSAEEGERALRGGADLIDVKEPLRGALGAADATAVRQVVATVGSRVPVSVALGELQDVEFKDGRFVQIRSTHERTLVGGVEFAKFGLAGCAKISDWCTRWRQAAESLPAAVKPVAVFYADWQRASAPDPEEVFEIAAEAGCRTALIDTFDKSRGNVLSHWPVNALCRFVSRLRAEDMTVVLGGSLRLDNLREAAAIAPDYLAVRGAVCAGDRGGHLREGLVLRLSRRLAMASSREPSMQDSRG